MYKAKGVVPLVEIVCTTQNSALMVEAVQLLAILARSRMYPDCGMRIEFGRLRGLLAHSLVSGE